LLKSARPPRPLSQAFRKTNSIHDRERSLLLIALAQRILAPILIDKDQITFATLFVINTVTYEMNDLVVSCYEPPRESRTVLHERSFRISTSPASTSGSKTALDDSDLLINGKPSETDRLSRGDQNA
jgi:hypothetical protein